MNREREKRAAAVRAKYGTLTEAARVHGINLDTLFDVLHRGATRNPGIHKLMRDCGSPVRQLTPGTNPAPESHPWKRNPFKVKQA